MHSQLEFSFSTRERWTGDDPGGHQQALYEHVVAMIEAEEEEFSELTVFDMERDRLDQDENLIAWWNRYVRPAMIL